MEDTSYIKWKKKCVEDQEKRFGENKGGMRMGKSS